MKTGICRCLMPLFAFIAGGILTFLALAAMQPDEFRVSRSAVINAPPAVVFDKVNDLQNWNSFSPWAKLDPKAKTAFDGPQAGEGATMSWDGNNKVGAGRMTIAESRPSEMVKFNLVFKKPFAGAMTSEFAFRPDDAGTFVTWTSYGKSNFLSKAMSLVYNCDAMMGKYFEQGLANLNDISRPAQ